MEDAMGYPDNMNWAAYDRTIGSVQSDAEQVYAAHFDHVLAVCSQAWQEYPLDASRRWSRVDAALLRAADSLRLAGVSLIPKDVSIMADEIERARDANRDGDTAAFRQNVEAYLMVFARAIEREGL
jgi:hypothetical protein